MVKPWRTNRRPHNLLCWLISSLSVDVYQQDQNLNLGCISTRPKPSPAMHIYQSIDHWISKKWFQKFSWGFSLRYFLVVFVYFISRNYDNFSNCFFAFLVIERVGSNSASRLLAEKEIGSQEGSRNKASRNPKITLEFHFDIVQIRICLECRFSGSKIFCKNRQSTFDQSVSSINEVKKSNRRFKN